MRDVDAGAAARGRARPGRGASASSRPRCARTWGPDRRRRDQRGDHPGRARSTPPTWSPARPAWSPGWPWRRRCSTLAGGRRADVDVHVADDGDRVARGDVLATVTGPTRTLLTAERTALNLLCRMSGVATHTRGWADAARRHQGAGAGHPQDHARPAAAGEVRGPRRRRHQQAHGPLRRRHDQGQPQARGGLRSPRRTTWSGRTFPDVPVQVEVTTLAEAEEAVAAGRDFLLCDNMSPELLREVVAAVGDRAELEATGGLTLEVAAEYAATGVDYLSVGALTHSSPILDIALGPPSAAEEDVRCCSASTSGTPTPCWPPSTATRSCTRWRVKTDARSHRRRARPDVPRPARRRRRRDHRGRRLLDRARRAALAAHHARPLLRRAARRSSSSRA